MSWAAENPEAYNEIEEKGVTEKISETLVEHGFDDMDLETIKAVVYILREEGNRMGPQSPNFWFPLVVWAGADISDAEADKRGV